ncbi:MAG: imidazole glycerol phosphate synthase subunit HisH [Planctomycetes bacterium]|nr:imidazole glycerol phosphate synthase subunit HisH [Planctomycetota bacterium]
MTSDIVIVDYGMANLRSVQKAFEQVGHTAEITSDADRIAKAHKVVLPGVGAFCDAIARLRETHLGSAITDHIKRGRPFLGICLGMQMLFTRSFEDGQHAGLDLFHGDVVRFPSVPGLKVPQMGWNTLDFTQPTCPLLANLPAEAAVYFVHSYYVAPTDPKCIAATADYPTPFTAVVWRDNVFATQFHPEKSQRVGLQMLKNFAEYAA